MKLAALYILLQAISTLLCTLMQAQAVPWLCRARRKLRRSRPEADA